MTLRRAFSSRRLAAQGAARQRALLAATKALAASYEKKLSFEETHLVVAQSLLPFLWRSGALGGRTFDVLAAALPIDELQKQLDRAFALHPDSPTLSDFRAERWLVEAESEALLNARKIITPHRAVAALFPSQSVLLDWHRPTAKRTSRRRNAKPVIVYPASTVGRKGCYELREAVRGLDVEILTLGAIVEDAAFWSGFDRSAAGEDWLARADLVVLPAFVEHKPRRPLLAAAHGVPVIASDACGLEHVAGVETVAAGDAAALRERIENALKSVEGIPANDACPRV